MRLTIIILLTLTLGCSRTSKKTSDELPREKLLGELFDEKGHLKRRVITGMIPGEDNYLTITRFDTLGNIIAEYGAKPYGEKFKTVYKIDKLNRVTEKTQYTFDVGEFENYGQRIMDIYELTDTLVGFEVSEQNVYSKLVFEFDDTKGMTREKRYYSELDSLTKTKKMTLEFDTLYSSVKTNSHQQ